MVYLKTSPKTIILKDLNVRGRACIKYNFLTCFLNVLSDLQIRSQDNKITIYFPAKSKLNTKTNCSK